MSNKYAYTPIYADEITEAYLELEEEYLATDIRSTNEDTVRNAYKLAGAKCLYNELIALIKQREADK